MSFKGVCSICGTVADTNPSLLLATNIINGDPPKTGAKSLEELFVMSKHDDCAGSGEQPFAVIEEEE